jgi:hypothetical protein
MRLGAVWLMDGMLQLTRLLRMTPWKAGPAVNHTSSTKSMMTLSCRTVTPYPLWPSANGETSTRSLPSPVTVT